jgi:hypothetical protein
VSPQGAATSLLFFTSKLNLEAHAMRFSKDPVTNILSWLGWVLIFAAIGVIWWGFPFI